MQRPAAIATLLLLVGSCLSCSRSDNRTKVPEVTRLTVAQVGDFFLYAPLYVALDAGFFKEQNLEVSIVTTGGDDKSWAAVISNSAQFGIGDPTFIAASSERGQPGVVVGSIVNGVPFWGVTWNPALKPIRSPAELRNLKVATFPAPSTAYVLQEKMFKDGSLKPSIAQGAFGSLLGMVRTGRADIALELEPNVSQAVADGGKILYSMKDVYGDFAITGLMTTPRFVQENPAAVAGTTCALQKALDLIQKKPDRALEILRRRFPDVREDVAGAALRRVTNDGIIPSTLDTSKAAWQKAVDLRISVKDLSGPASFNTFVDNRFADQAARDCRIE